MTTHACRARVLGAKEIERFCVAYRRALRLGAGCEGLNVVWENRTGNDGDGGHAGLVKAAWPSVGEGDTWTCCRFWLMSLHAPNILVLI